MGLFDTLTGRKKLKQPAPDRLFAMSTAAIQLDAEAHLKSSREAAIVFQALQTADFDQIVDDMEEILRSLSSDINAQVRHTDDTYGYRWMILADDDFDSLVVGLNAVSSEIQAGGYGDRLLAAVFVFKDQNDKPVYWIYNFKRGKFYPFVPAPGESQRDSERELRLKAQIGSELPVEEDLSRWFPMWGIPI